MPKGQKHHTQVMAAAVEIVRGLEESGATVCSLMDKYECGYSTLKRAILTRLSAEEYRVLCRRKLANGGRATRFQRGHVPWTRGVKGIHLSVATEFNAGHIRGAAARRYRALGSIVIRKGKPLSRRKDARRRNPSRWIKVRDDGRPQDRFIPYARWLWERQYGPVPPGHFIVHRDNNTMNDRLDNLMLVNRRNHMLRLYERPGVIAKCRARSSVATKRRHREKRIVRESGIRTRTGQVVWECPACAAEVRPGTDKCPKCGAIAFEKRELSPRCSSYLPS